MGAFGTPWGPLGSPWEPLGSPWGPLGSPLGSPWGLMLIHFSIFEDPMASLSLSWPLLMLFLASLSLTEPTFFDFLESPEPQNPPRTSKINEKPMVFRGVRLFSFLAQDCRKSFEKTPKMLPISLQHSPKPVQDPFKMF